MSTFDAPDWQTIITIVTGGGVTDAPDWQNVVVGPGGQPPINLSDYTTTTGISITDTSTDGFTLTEAGASLFEISAADGLALVDNSTFGIVIEEVNSGGAISISGVGGVVIGGTTTVGISTSAGDIQITSNGGSVEIARSSSDKLAFYAATPVAKPTVTGSKGGNAALASLCTALANLGLITNSTT